MVRELNTNIFLQNISWSVSAKFAIKITSKDVFCTICKTNVKRKFFKENIGMFGGLFGSGSSTYYITGLS